MKPAKPAAFILPTPRSFFRTLSLKARCDRFAVAMLLLLLGSALGRAQTFTIAHNTFSTPVGQTLSQNITLTVNTAVPITSIGTAPNFSEYKLGTITGCTVDPTGATVEPVGTVCTIPVTFKPATPGKASSAAPIARSAPLLVTDVENGKATGYTFPLSGTATGPLASFYPGTVSQVAPSSASFPICAQETDKEGDGCPAADVAFSIAGTAVDNAGNIFILEQGAYDLRRIDAKTGIVSTVAGQWRQQESALSGNGGPATKAGFNVPAAVAVDSQDNVYVADNSYLSKINAASGIINAIAGDGSESPSLGGPALKAAINGTIQSVVIDSAGNVFFAAYSTVYRIDGTTGLISFVVGNGAVNSAAPATGVPGPASAAVLGQQLSLALDSAGNLYIADYQNYQVYQVKASTSAISVYAGTFLAPGTSNNGCSNDTGDGGPATSAFTNAPSIIAFDSEDNLYIAEAGCGVIRRVDASTGFIHVVEGNYTGGPVIYNAADTSAFDTDFGPAGAFSIDPSGNMLIGSSNGLDKVTSGTASIFFPSETSGSVSDETNFVTLDNIGVTTTLAFDNQPFPTSGPPYTTYALTGTTPDDCSTLTSLAPGASCGIGVSFNPTGNGTFNGTVTVGDNSLNVPAATQTVSLLGTVKSYNKLTFTPNPLTFPTVAVGSSSTINVLITDSNPITSNPSTFYILGDTTSFSTGTISCTALAGGGSTCTVPVVFTPTGAGPLTCTLEIQITGAGTEDITVSGTGETPASQVTLSPTSLAFPNTTVGFSSSLTASLSNTGNATLTISSIVPSDTVDFSESDNCAGSVTAGGSCKVTVTFTPSVATAFTASLNFKDNAPDTPQSLPLSGTGVAQVPQLQFTPAQLTPLAGSTTKASPQCKDAGDGGPALSATFCGPYGTAEDAAGNLYIADESDNYVRKVAANGTITAFAGSPSLFTSGNSGDGGLATAALLSSPVAVASDSLANVYITDSGNGRIRKVDSGGTITEFVGGASGTYFTPGTSGSAVVLNPGGITFDPSNNLYIADESQQIVVKVTPAGLASVFAGVLTAQGPGVHGYNGDNIAATSADLNAPNDVFSDAAGNIFIADTGNFRVRRVDAVSGLITTVAGNGTQGDSGDGAAATSAEINAVGVSVNLAGDIFINTGFSIRKVDATKAITTVAGGGTAALSEPAPGVQLGAMGIIRNGNDGSLLLPSSSVFYGVLSVGPNGLLDFGSVAVGSTSAPQSVTFENTGNGSLSLGQTGYTATAGFHVTGGTCAGLTKLAPGANCTLTVTFAPTVKGSATGSIGVVSNSPDATESIVLEGTGTQVLAPAVTLSPTSVAFPSQAANTTSLATVVQLTNSGTASLTGIAITLAGADSADFALPVSTISPCGTTLGVGDSCNISVTFKPSSAGSFSASISVADDATGSPQLVPLTGTGTSPAVAQLQFNPSQLTVIAGTGKGSLNGSGDGGPALSATFDSPINAAQDAAGNIYVVDQDANDVRKIDTSGNISLFAGVPGYGPGGFGGDNGPATLALLSNPIGVAVDSAGNVYIADYGNARIRKVVPSTGTITTYAGAGNGFYSGANAPNTVIPGPQGICFDPANNLYIASTNDQLILKITAAGATSILAGVLDGSDRGTNGYNGDNIPASQADLSFPDNVACDSAGNVYIADTGNSRIRKVTAATGFITTIAGNGTDGDTGDGGPATAAEVDAWSVAADLAGDVYITSTHSNANGATVREVDVNGNINTIAGGGTTGDGGESLGTKFGPIGYSGIDNNGSLIIPSFDSSNQTDEVFAAGPAGFLQFGTVNVGSTSAPQTVTFENTGNAPLLLSQTTYTASGAFKVTGGTCAGLAALPSGATCTLSVTFTPTSATTFNGSIGVNSNATVPAQTINLQGIGAEVLAPEASLNPTTISFPNTTVGSTATALSTQLSNPGTATLNISGITITGTNFADFAISGNTCGATLAAGDNCTISVTFTPASASSFTALLSVADNVTGSPQTVALSGTGTAAIESVTGPFDLAFSPAPVPTGIPQTLIATFQILNYPTLLAPTATLHYGNSYVLGTFSCTGLAGAQTCSVPVTFTPDYPGGRKDALFLTSGGTRLATVLLYGVGQSPFSLFQPGTETTYSNLGPSGTDFYQAVVDENGISYVLNLGAKTVFSVTRGGVATQLPITLSSFPRTLGIDGAGVLSMHGETFDDSVVTYDTVQGIQGTLTLPSAIGEPDVVATGNTGNFYAVDYNTQVLYTVLPDGTYTSIALSPTLGGNPAAMTVDDAEDVFVASDHLNEITAGAVQTQINSGSTTSSFSDLATDAAHTVYYSGFGSDFGELAASDYTTILARFFTTGGGTTGIAVAPDGTIMGAGGETAGFFYTVDRSTGTFAFPNTAPASTSTAQIVSLYNGGNEVLTLATITPPSAAFTVTPTATNGCSNGLAIQPGAICQLSVAFTPTVPGSFTSSIVFTTNSLNAQAATQTFVLSGNSAGLSFTVLPNPLNFPDQTSGTTSTPLGVTVTNTGYNTSAIIDSPSSTNPAFAVTFGTCVTNLAPGQSCQLSVTFSPTASQPYTGTVKTATSIVGGGTGPSFSFTVNGTGAPAAAPQAVLNPTTISFPNTTVGSTATAISTKLSNPGSATLNISGITLTGTNPTDFAISSNTCGTTLAAGANCTISVTFTPAAAASYSASLSVADNATGSPQTVPLSGTGTAPQATLNPTTISFPNTAVGSTATAISTQLSNPGSATLNISGITLTGTNPTDFAISSNTCGTTLAAGANCTISVTFTPAAAASYSASLSVADNATGSPQTVPLSGTGTAPQATLNPTTISFPNTAVGSTATAISTQLSNPGSATLNISGITLTGTNPTDFAISSNTCGTTLAAGANCTISITFTPAAALSYSASLSVADNVTGSPQTVSLTGTGTAAQATLSPTTISFPNTTVGSTATAISTQLSNPGSATLNISGITLTGTNPTDFAISSNTCGTTLAAGANCTISITFTPAAALSYSASLSVADNVTGSPQTVSLTGTGTAAQATLSPTTISFPNTTVGSTATAISTQLSNPGSATLNISGITLTGTNPTDFAISSNTCGTTLAAGANCTISITFTPAAALSYSASLSVADNVTGSPQTVSLTGTGTAAQATLNPTTISFPSTPVGSTATAISTQLSNPGSATLNISGITLTGTNPTDFAISSNTCGTTLAAGANCTISITFTPAAAVSYSASLSVADNVSGSPQTVSLTGTGTPAATPQAVLKPTSISFPNTAVGSTATALSTVLSNPGNATLTISGITLTGANPNDFTITANTCGVTLAAGANCSISATFTPASATTFTASITVADNATNSPQNATLTGTGTVALATDFTIVAVTPTNQVQPDANVSYTIDATGVGGAYNSPITFTASGLPAGATYAFAPPSVTPGSTGASTVLTIHAPSLFASLAPRPHSQPPWLAALLLIPLAGLTRLRRVRNSRLLAILLVALTLAPVMAVAGCAGGYYQPEPETYTVTVTGTSGQLQHSTTVTLTVE